MLQKTPVQTLVSDFEYIAQNLPTITGIRPQSTGNGSLKFRVNYLHPNFRESTFHNASYLFRFAPKENPSIEKLSDFPALENFVSAEAFSPSKSFRALIRAAPDKTLLEIWGQNGLLKSIKISDYHGPIYSELDFVIEALTWSADERRIVYMAERKPPAAPKLFSHFNSEQEAKNSLNNFGYAEDFGEMYRGKGSPVIFVYDFEEDQLYQVLNVPENITPSQVSFTDKSGKSLVFCGFRFEDIKLGMKFTANRESKIYYLPQIVGKGLRPQAKKLTPEDLKLQEEKIKSDLVTYKAVKINNDDISQAPIVSKDFTKLVYLFSSKKKTIIVHFGIKVVDISGGSLSEKSETRIVFEVPKSNEGDFLGIATYQNRLTRMRFLANSNFFVFNSYWRSSLALFIGNTESKQIRRIDKTKWKSGECRLDAVEGDVLFTSLSNIANERNFAVFEGIDTSTNNLDDALKNAIWHDYDFTPEKSPQISKNLNGALTNLDIEEKIVQVKSMESVFFSLKGASDPNKPKPLILFIHGGPHGISTAFFSTMMYYALYKGCNVLYPNFPGTTGFGQEAEESLLGRVGELDAEEVKATLEHLFQQGLADPKRVICVGLSYGGFLTGVMLAKYPDLFKIAVLQNPAISMVNMYEASDVPDWPLAEVLNIDMTHDVTGDMYKKMFEASPLGMSKDIKASVLLMIGEKDRRIPAGPSLIYYKILKGKGVDVQLALYPNDEHILAGTPDSISDQFVRLFNLIDEKLE